ncbi:pyridoxamine 5'-phosphate oxidase family protein [Streptomyces sp. NY05-11A]|nr:pyridoxamine 5'-phosphate oxidase family protein [Streptomyces sp. NY05-11A]MDX2674978.1 pyridoxamine 5'-phosphate oxidase family protein [Streptomyces sp. NY05-11A]
MQRDAYDARQCSGADTFFIAGHSPDHGADASHRGGEPGFVTVHGARRLSWPDYVGNSFYMTLGNLHLNGSCGLLFLDWEQGHTLQLTGRPGSTGILSAARRCPAR